MRHVLFQLALVVAATITAVSMGAYVTATTVEYRRDESAALDRGTKIAGLGLDAAKWTGWISTSNVRSIAFDIDFTDANDSVTAVTMVCETSRSSDTADDAGRDIHTVSISSGTIASSVATWSYTLTGGQAWTWTVSNIPAPWLNCKFDATGTPASIDIVTVYARGISP